MIKRRMREKGMLCEEVVEEPAEERRGDLFGLFCEAAEKAGVMYILKSEIPDL